MQIDQLPVNTTFDYANKCGMNNCPNTKLQETASKPTLHSVYNLLYTLIVATTIGIIISLLFVDDFKFDENSNEIKREQITKQFLSN